MKWFLSLFGGGIYGYLIAAGIAAALSIGATAFIISNIKNTEIANLKREAATQKAVNVTASLQQLQNIIASMHASANEYGDLQAAVFAKLNGISAEFRNAIKANPLPVDCRPGPDRLRSLSAAISAVNNSAIGQ